MHAPNGSSKAYPPDRMAQRKQALRLIVGSLKKFGIYVGKVTLVIAAIATSIIFWVSRVPQKYWIAQRWVGLVIFTVAVFGFTIYSGKHFRRRILFWLAVVALFVVHSMFWYFLLRPVESFQAAWFALLLTPDGFVLAYLIGWSEIYSQGFKRWPRSWKPPQSEA